MKTKNPSKAKKRHIYPNSHNAERGPKIAPWLLSLALPPEQVLVYAVIARLAGARATAVGASVHRVARITHMSEANVRRAVQSLEVAGLIEGVHRNGQVPTFRFPWRPEIVGGDGTPKSWVELLAMADEVDRCGERGSA